MFFFKIQIHHKSQGCIETYRWAEPPCSCKDGVHQQVDCGDVLSNKPSITEMEASTSHPLANWLLNFEEANIGESGLQTNCDASQKKTSQSWWSVVPNQNLKLSSSINYFPSWPPRVHLHVEIQPPPACLHIDPQPVNVNQIHRTWNPFVSTFFASTFEFKLVFPFHSELSAIKAPSTI